MNDEYYMRLALEEASKAFSLDEVPIGCVIVRDGKVISKKYNQKSLKNIATYHAEVLAINEACCKLGTWYLDDCTVYTTVEPCMMCCGAIQQARVSRVVYGTKNEAFGYLSKVKNNKIDIKGNVLDKECTKLLSDFFKKKRN